MHGNAVLPMMIKNAKHNKGNTASWKEFIESGVKAKPRSLKADAAVKIPHHGRPTPSALTTSPHLGVVIIQPTMEIKPKRWKPT
jgi:hypothetical protein